MTKASWFKLKKLAKRARYSKTAYNLLKIDNNIAESIKMQRKQQTDGAKCKY